MPKLSGIGHLRAVRAFERAGFRVARQGKHIILTDGKRIITIPRADPVNSFTLAVIIKDAGLSIEEFRRLLLAALLDLEEPSSTAVSSPAGALGRG